MSLPNGFLDELRTRTSLSQVVGRKVTFDSKKSNPGKGDYWAPCPFHQEKTASFHLDDRKGFYYCFGCHAKGDALNFIRETENVGFMEAVEILAREAGMTIPARDPKAQEKADHATELAAVMEQAVQFYRLQLNTSAAAEARDYLLTRRLKPETQERFEIGFAPNGRTALFQHLTGKGVKPEQIVEAGLSIKPDDGGKPFDRFRHRIMFPIRDARGRATAFGGRAMDPNARAKYLNSNETLLFDKGRTLYNLAPAREAAGKADTLIVAEGYMDVIALHQGGFPFAVAPLGTAITEDQLRLLWRLHAEPIIALDGDTAGVRAAMRLIDLALPLLEPGRSLRFCLMPEGKDPDDILRTEGKSAMQALLDKARPLVELLWQRETEGKIFDSPERRAALDASLKTAIGKIGDASVRNHYFAAVKEYRAALFTPKRTAFTPFKKGQPRGPVVQPTTKSSRLAQASEATAGAIREDVILALLLSYPAIIPALESALERTRFSHPMRARLADMILTFGRDFNQTIALNTKLTAELGEAPLETLLANAHVRIAPGLNRPFADEDALRAVSEELAKLESARGISTEITDAMEDITGEADEGLTWRLSQAAEARNKATRSSLPEGGTESEDRENMSQYLQNLIDGEVWVKKKQ